MRRLAIALVLAAAAAAQPAPEKTIHRLDSIVVDLVEGQIRMNVTVGHLNDNGKFLIERMLPEYVLDPAHMQFDGDSRPLGADADTALVRSQRIEALMRALANYCRAAIEWWDSNTPEAPKTPIELPSTRREPAGVNLVHKRAR
ncbi:MAG: hypothetical protein U0Q18_25305 [Bryobacteraceae bacterium]